MSIVAGFTAAAIYAILVLIALRIWTTLPPLPIHLLSALLVHVVTTLSLLASGADWNYWQMAAAYWLFFMFYLYVYNAFYKSLSLTILGFIANGGGNSARTSDILDKIVIRSFADRARILETGGLVSYDGSTFSVSKRGTKTAGILCQLRRELKIKEGGLYFG